MQAVILCGGKGTRLSPLTKYIPKPMLPIKGIPVLEHQIKYLKQQGITDIILAAGYLKEQIFNHFGCGDMFGVNINYVVDEQLGTAGALKQVQIYTKNKSFFVLNGDTLFNVNLADMVRHHKTPVTIAVAEAENADRYGVLIDGKLQEKVKVEKGIVSIGLYLINPEVFDLIPEGFSSLEKDIFPQIKQGFYHYSGEWFDMGTFESYEKVR